jgi:hypothetical protein
MIKKGPLPNQGQIDFELNEVQLDMLEKGLISTLPMEAIVSYPENPELGKKKIRLTIEAAYSPGLFIPISISTKAVSNILNGKTADGLSRCLDYFMDKIIAPKSWVLMGKTQGDDPVPIIIMFNPILKLGTYSFKKKEESMESFNPQNN